jgi:hypothetical protein
MSGLSSEAASSKFCAQARTRRASVGPLRAPSLITPADMAHQRNQPSMGDSLKTPHSVSLKVLRYVISFAATTILPSDGINGIR